MIGLSAGAVMLTVTTLIIAGSLGVCFFTMLRSIRDHRNPSRSVWREFGLSIACAAMFVASWIGQLIAQWQQFTDEARTHGESPEVGNFFADFWRSTLENWQSEFLGVLVMIALGALFIHKGSADSKDGEENIQASLRRIEEHLGTLPNSAPTEPGRQWELPETPLEMEDQQRAHKERAR